LAKLSSVAEELDAGERLQLFRDFFRTDEPAAFPFDMNESARKGHSFKDWICPESMEFYSDHFKINGRYGRVVYMQDYASYVKDDMIAELCGLSRDLMLSIDILPVPTDEAVREIQNRLLGVETNVTNWQRRQNANNNFSAVVPYDMELQRKETKEMLEDLTTRDQRMMFGLLTMVHMAESKEQLDSDTETLFSVARKHLCQLSTLKWQQMDGLNTVLPYGLRKIDALRTMTTESTAVLIPFHTQEIMQPGGIYYGQNAVSKNMLVADRRKLLNGNSFRLGVSGSGKSFSAKEEIVDLALSTEDDILILDPESEFGSLVEALNGEVIRISATSDTHLNAMDMDQAYGNDRNPLIEKSEFILSLFEQLVGAGNLSAKEKSILDRCTADVYREYINSGYQGEVPTLKDLYRQLLLQPEEEARGLALSSELFVNGSLNTFARTTNVNTKSRITAYDIRELGEQLMPLGMLVTLDSIFNRVIQNWKRGKTTWIFADEFYLLFRYEYSADFFYRLYKRIRKYNGFVTGLTQNVEELLKSDTARLMLANSEFLVLLNQASTDRDELANLLNISENQLSYITNVGAGHGLIRCSGNIVPFENSFPKNTALYRLMTTKPGEMQVGQ
jgi:type IV secretory pathway VirB4 component